MASSLVSVILPFYNAAATIRDAVDSIQRQSCTDWELVAFDDGSTDDSRGIVAGLAQADARIRVVGGQRVGIVAALQGACRAASGAYLMRMDADDVAVPERMARQLALVQSAPEVGLCGTEVRIVGEDVGPGLRRYEAWINALAEHGDMTRELFVECPLPHPTFFLPRDVYDAVGGYQDHGWPEDYDLVMRVWRAGRRLATVPVPLLEWRHTPQRLSMTDPRYHEAAFRRLKRHYLHEAFLAAGPPLYQWGAGEVGKRWLREWESPRPAAVVDINPRKIGRSIHDTRVIAPEALPPPGEAFVGVAVGAPGARDEIRDWFAPRGYVELRDYLFLA